MTAATLEKVTKRLVGQTLGGSIDDLWKLREQKRVAEAAVKEIETKIATAEEVVMEKLDKEGLDKAQGKAASISVSSNVTANVIDWDAFHAWIGKTKSWHLLQKRVSDPAYRELLEQGKRVPGAQPFTKRRLNLRSLSST